MKFARASMVNIWQSTILELPMPVPPPEEQLAIIDASWDEVSRCEPLMSDVRCAVRERRSALSAVVTGTIDVHNFVMADVASAPEAVAA